MSSELDLAHLHQQHLALKEVLDQITRGQRQVKAKENQMAQLDAQRTAKEDELKATRMAGDRKNLDLKSNEVKLKDLERKLNEAGNNREFDILRGQIDADTAANAVLQDEILELLDKVDRLHAEIAELQGQRVKAETDRDRLKSEHETRCVDLRQQETVLRQRIKAAEQPLPPQLCDQYRRLVEAHGAEALAPVSDRACGFCNVGLTAQQAQRIRAGEPMSCGTCGRLLYASKSDA